MLCLLILMTIIPISEAETKNEEDTKGLPATNEEMETLGLTYHVFLVGLIRNLNRFGPEITFQTVFVYYYDGGSVSIISGGYLSIERPFIGILTPIFICGFYSYTVHGW